MSNTAPELSALLEGLKSPDWEVRARSACALGEFTDRAKVVVIGAQKGPTREAVIGK